MSRRTGRRGAAALLTCALLLTGCGGDPSTPAESVPELGEKLSDIDDAVVAERYGQAQRHLDELVKVTVAARDAGDLEDAQADRVLAAAARLLAALPEAPTAPTPSVAPTPTPSPSPAQPEEDKGDEEAQKKQEELEKKLEEELKKLEEQQEKDGGGNGPDDGHGN